jgi:KTSC domain
MKRTSVDSSMMASVGYSASRRTLEIEFRSGDVYRYFDVPEKEFHALLASASKGRFFQTRISGVYDFERVISRTATGRYDKAVDEKRHSK